MWKPACNRVMVCLVLCLMVMAIAGTVRADETVPHVVFLTGEDPHNYEAHETVPAFAAWLEEEGLFRTTVSVGEGPLNAHHFPNLDAVADADVLVIFFRRRAVTQEQLDIIKAHLAAGKPLVGIRTANHAFSVHEDPETGLPDGHVAWWEFVSDILGCENRGYGPVEPGTSVTPASGVADHPILEGATPLEWHSAGNVYLVAPLLDDEAQVLLWGEVEDKKEPIAWTRTTDDGSPVFYTSLGHPSDFDVPQFRRLLVNGLRWAADKATQ